MNKNYPKIVVSALVMIALSGCVVIINQGKPSDEEQQLINIQQQSSQQATDLNQKIGSGDYSIDQIKTFIDQAEKSVQENLQKIDQLKIPERARSLAQKTVEYLQTAKQTYQAILQLSTGTNNKVQELLAQLKTMTEPLLNLAKQMDQIQQNFLQQLQKAAQSP